MPRRIQTLLTGFGPFGNIVSNPTERLVKHFDTIEVVGQDILPCILPTSYLRAPAQLRAVLEVGGRNGRPFDNVLMLGVATGSPRWRVERFGRNRDTVGPDVDGFAPPPDRKIDPDAPDTLPVTLPVETLVAALEGIGLPTVASEDAGGYLCNHALFQALRHVQQSGLAARVGFLHVPADEFTFQPGLTSASLFPFARQVEAVHAVLGVIG